MALVFPCHNADDVSRRSFRKHASACHVNKGGGRKRKKKDFDSLKYCSVISNPEFEWLME